MPSMTRPRPSTQARRPRRVDPSRRPGLQTSRATRASRATAGGLRPAIRRRRQPQQTGLKGMLSKASHAVPSALSGMTGSKKGGSGARKPAGMALMAGAAGLAFKNRDKIGSMLGRGKSHEEPGQEQAMPATPNATAPSNTPPPAGTPNTMP